MKQNEDNTYRIDTDKAWNILHERLENDHLLTINEPGYSQAKKRKVLFQRTIVAAAISIGIIIAGSFLLQKKDNTRIVMQNMENSGALVTTLEDGSTVYLASNASISYPAAFAKNSRKVELTGNALFYVAKDEKRPFVIEASGITIEVVGTIFAIHSSSGNLFELSVKQGKVNIHSKDDQIGIPVEAGEMVQLTGNGLSKSGISNSMVFSSYTDIMYFKDEKLNRIIQAINTIHGYPVIITDESINDRTLTFTFKNDSVENLTELICTALNLKQINKQDTIFIQPF